MSTASTPPTPPPLPTGDQLYELFWGVIEAPGSLFQPDSLLLEVGNELLRQRLDDLLPKQVLDLKRLKPETCRVLWDFLEVRAKGAPQIDKEKFRELLARTLGR